MGSSLGCIKWVFLGFYLLFICFAIHCFRTCTNQNLPKLCHIWHSMWLKELNFLLRAYCFARLNILHQGHFCCCTSTAVPCSQKEHSNFQVGELPFKCIFGAFETAEIGHICTVWLTRVHTHKHIVTCWCRASYQNYWREFQTPLLTRNEYGNLTTIGATRHQNYQALVLCTKHLQDSCVSLGCLIKSFARLLRELRYII